MSSNWLPAILGKKNKIEKEVAVISESVKKISGDAKKMGTALVTLNNNVTLIDRTIDELKDASYEKPKAFIDNLDLDDEYKESLKQELEDSRQDALNTLAPIKDASEKIRGNMVVSMVKYQSMVKSLTAQKNVIESGTIQVEAIDRAKQMGAFSNEKIVDLVQRAEAINRVTKDAINGWDTSNNQIKDTLKGFGKNSDMMDVFDVT